MKHIETALHAATGTMLGLLVGFVLLAAYSEVRSEELPEINLTKIERADLNVIAWTNRQADEVCHLVEEELRLSPRVTKEAKELITAKVQIVANELQRFAATRGQIVTELETYLVSQKALSDEIGSIGYSYRLIMIDGCSGDQTQKLTVQRAGK